RLLSFAACAAPGAPRRRGIELGRYQPHGIALSGPATPAVPFSLNPTTLPQPAQHMHRLAPLGFQGEGRWVDADHHVGLLVHRRGYTAAVAITAVGHDDLPGVPAIPL